MNHGCHPPFPSPMQRALHWLAWIVWHCGGHMPCRDDSEWSIARFGWVDRYLDRTLTDEELWANFEWKMRLWEAEA